MTSEPEVPAEVPAAEPSREPARRRTLRARLRGPWRVIVAEGSMLPGIEPGDWLLVDPTPQAWPRPGSVVVFREPVSDGLAVKRVRARAGERVPFNGGYIVLGEGEAWLEADATAATAAKAGFGPPIDSERFGPVPIDLLVGRVWFRYGPWSRVGRIRRTTAP